MRMSTLSLQPRQAIKIAFVLNSLSTGGAEIHTVGLARALTDRGYICQIISLSGKVEIEACGVPVERLAKKGLLSLASHRLLASSLKRFGPDVVVAINGLPAASVCLARMISLVKWRFITVYHTTRIANIKQRAKHIAHLPFLNRSEVVVFVSANQSRYCLRRGLHGRRNLIIHNGVDRKKFNPAARDSHRKVMRAYLGISDNEFVIGQSAAFRTEKNHTQSIEALAVLRARGVPAKLMLLGDGPERRRIESLAVKLGVQDFLLIAGRQADVVPWLSAFDVGILTSTAIETFSLAALEIMAMGVPAVLSDIGGADEMLIDGCNGYLFRPNDTSALVKALEVMIEPSARAAMGKVAAERVGQLFTLNDMIDHYEQLLIGVVSQC